MSHIPLQNVQDVKTLLCAKYGSIAIYTFRIKQ